MSCSIHACVTHSSDKTDTKPCVIRLKKVDVVIEPYAAQLVADNKIICSYAVSTPFTGEQLQVLNAIDSSDPSVYIRELKRVTRTKCGICACTAHKCGVSGPCKIPIEGVFQGELIIEPHSVSFQSSTQKVYLYEVTYPFTREQLVTLNDIDSQEPADYVRALKIATKRSFRPIQMDTLKIS